MTNYLYKFGWKKCKKLKKVDLFLTQLNAIDKNIRSTDIFLAKYKNLAKKIVKIA